MTLRRLADYTIAALLALAVALPALAAVNQQHDDGSVSVVRERDGLDVGRQGGYMGAAGSNVPGYQGGSTLMFNVAGGTDTGGGILGWTNNLGYDIIVLGHQLEVTTVASAAATVSCGQTPTSATTSSSNMISGQDTHTATGVFNGGALSVKVANGTFITCSKASGATAGMVARVFFQFIADPAAGNP
jgi:hypothetical protein